jgi:hypothetical protein
MSGGMPVLEVATFLPNVKSLYLTLIPVFFFVNNFLGPKRMEPVFTRDFLMAHFDKISSAESSAKAVKFTPTPGKVPQLPKFGRQARVAGLIASVGLLAFVKPVAAAAK